MAEVIQTDALQNDRQRESFVAEGLGRKYFFAKIAAPKLNGFEFFLAHTLSDDVSTRAIRAALGCMADAS